MGYSSLHDAVMDASVSHAMNQMSTGDVDVAATNAGYVGSAPVSAEEGYDQLRDSIDDSIAALVATKEQVNQAEATNDPSLLKAASASLTASLDNSTSFWEVQTEGDGPVPVPYERVITYPCEGFCVTDLMALVVLATALTFISTGEKLHKYLICAMGMTIGTFAGLFYCAQLGIVEDKPKWSVSLAAGLALWIAVMFVESIVFNALSMGIGGGVCMIGYSVVIQYIPPQPEYYMFITIGVGVVVGYFCSNIVKAAALKVIYSVMGGFLTGSCVSYLFWKLRMTQGDLWLDNLVSHGVGLDLSKWQTLTCIGVMVVASFAGVMIQNATAKKGGKKDDKKKAKDEEAGYGATDKK